MAMCRQCAARKALPLVPAGATRRGLRARRRIWTVLVLFLIPATASRIVAQNAPGNLPWGVPDNNGQQPQARNQGGSGHGQIFTLPGQLFHHASGILSFGFDSTSSNSYRSNLNDLGLTLKDTGYFLDPRLWSHTLSLDLDRAGADFGSSRVVGFNLNGTFLGSRSFPLQVIITRSATDASAPTSDTQATSQRFGLAWSLFQPKYINVDITAMFGGAEQENPFFTDASFQEHDQSITGNVHRMVRNWSLLGYADYLRIRTSLRNSESVLSGSGFRVDRPLADRGDFQTNFRHGLQSYTTTTMSRNANTLNQVQSSLTYRHTHKLFGSYSADYSTNIRESAIASLLRSPAGTQGGSIELNPGLRQALLSGGSNSSFGMHGGWTFIATDNLLFGANVGRAILDRSQPIGGQQGELRSYTNAGGDAAYKRTIGKWQTHWRGSLAHYWNSFIGGAGYADDRRAVGIGVNRRFGGWSWTSDFSYSDYVTGSATLPLQSEERWRNSINTRLKRGLRVELGGDFSHLDWTVPSAAFRTERNDNVLQFHGAVNALRWNVNGSTGLRNASSAIISLDISNPLNNAVLSQFTPLAAFASSVDHYANLSGGYRTRRHWSFQAGYRRDYFELLSGDFTRFVEMDFGVEYHLRRTIIAGGYQRQTERTTAVELGRSRIYIRIRRPFRIY